MACSRVLGGILGIALLSAQDGHAQIATEDMVVGDEESETAFTRIDDIVVRENRVYIMQRRIAQVHVYDTEGRFLQIIGRNGDGPGEFRIPFNMGWRGDTLWVSDLAHGRVSMFSGFDGTFLTSYQSVYDLERYPFVASGPSAVLAQRAMVVQPQIPSNLAHEAVDPLPVLVTTKEGDVVRHLGEIGVERSLRAPIGGSDTDFYAVLPQPFADGPLWAVSSNGGLLVFVGRRAIRESASIEVRAIDPSSGALVFERQYSKQTVRLRDQDVDRFIDNFVNGFSSELEVAMIRRLRRSLEENVYRPRWHPLVSQLFVDERSRTWLGMPEAGELNKWLVLESDGTLAGEFFAAHDVTLLDATDTHAWGVRMGKYDVPMVIRIRLPRDLNWSY